MSTVQTEHADYSQKNKGKKSMIYVFNNFFKLVYVGSYLLRWSQNLQEFVLEHIRSEQFSIQNIIAKIYIEEAICDLYDK